MSRGLAISTLSVPMRMPNEAVHDQREHVVERQRADVDELLRHRPAATCRAAPARSRPPSAARWRRGCRASASRPSTRRSCRPCTAGTRCPAASTATGSSLRRAPASSVSVNLTWPGSEYAGTIFFTRRTAKLTIAPFGKPSMSPSEATTTCLTAVRAITCCSVAREVLEDHDRLGAGVLELVLELARRVERIDVDDDVAGAQHARERDRVLHHVRHHDRDARARARGPATAARRRTPPSSGRSRRR